MTQRWRVLAAETALSERDVAAAQRLAELVLESPAAMAGVRCHALGLLGRSYRARDLEKARVAFEEALSCAEMANLPLWRFRALHELGTIRVFLAELAGLRRDAEEMERHNSLALAAAPGDREIEGSVWGGGGVAALLDGDEAGARQACQRAVECLAPLPNSGPGIYLGLWPLLLAVHADPGAGHAISSARRTGMTVNRANRGMLLYAEAVLAGPAS